jgi:hypothetical protein
LNFILRSLLALCFLCVSSFAFGQINPRSDIKWPTCSSLQYYSPFDNTCHSITAGSPANSLVKTGNYTVTPGDSFIQMNCASPCTLTLPSTVTTGFTVAVMRTGAGALTINPNSVAYDGITTGLLQGSSLYITTDGTGYHSTDSITSYTGCIQTFSMTGSSLTCSGSGYTLPSQYQTWACEPGLGDGLNAIPAGTYLQSTCWNKSGVTKTITGIACFTDNSGTSTMSVTDGSGTALLTGSITCSSSLAAGTQSGTVTIASGGFMKFTFVADGTSKQATFVTQGTY